MMFCRKNCRYLKPTEENQTALKEGYFCRKFKKQVHHGYAHPLIYKLPECKMGGYI